MTPLEGAFFQSETGRAICVQRFDDSLNSAIRTTYRISLRSSSLREPRYPSAGVVLFGVCVSRGRSPTPLPVRVLDAQKETLPAGQRGHKERGGHPHAPSRENRPVQNTGGLRPGTRGAKTPAPPRAGPHGPDPPLRTRLATPPERRRKESGPDDRHPNPLRRAGRTQDEEPRPLCAKGCGRGYR